MRANQTKETHDAPYQHLRMMSRLACVIYRRLWLPETTFRQRQMTRSSNAVIRYSTRCKGIMICPPLIYSLFPGQLLSASLAPAPARRTVHRTRGPGQ